MVVLQIVTSLLQFSLEPGAQPPCEAAKWHSSGRKEEGALCPQPVGQESFVKYNLG